MQEAISQNSAAASPDSKGPHKLLIILLGAIGDVTRALPLATRIKQHWPETELHWAIEPISKGILLGHPAIDKLITFERGKGLPAFKRFLGEIKSENYELVLDMQRHFKSGVISRSTKAERRIGFNRKGSREFNWLFNTESIPPVEKFSPKINQFQYFGDALGLPVAEELDFGLTGHDEDVSHIDSLAEGIDLSQTVGLILGSSWPSRFWIEDYYVELIDSLEKQLSLGAVLIGGPGEAKFAERIAEKSKDRKLVNLVGKTSLRELAEVFSRVKFAVGSDSGPMHIASAVNCRIISLWGATSSKRSAPHGSENLVLEAKIPCAPCYLKHCPGLGQRCMKSIKPEAVLAKVGEIS